MADEEFDIDIYGDTNVEEGGPVKKDVEGDTEIGDVEPNAANDDKNGVVPEEKQEEGQVPTKAREGNVEDIGLNEQQKIKSTDESGQDIVKIPRQAPQQQGVKRKEGSDDHDDLRGWVNQAQVEDELKDITIAEHKINGKSKGQAFIEFTSKQAATATKHKIDAFGEGQQYVKKPTVSYSNPSVNPFRTLPKDAPARAGKDGQGNRGVSNSYNNDRNNHSGSSHGGNYRGRTPSYHASRGAMHNNMNYGDFRRPFSPAVNNMVGGFSPQMGGGFSSNPMVSQFGGYDRGGMMGGMRGGLGNMPGGRGGMDNNMVHRMGGMGGMPMGGMPMSAMGAMGGMPGMPMNMGQIQGVMPMQAGAGGFQGQMPQPSFFPQNQMAGVDWQNPHGAKRPRPE